LLGKSDANTYGYGYSDTYTHANSTSTYAKAAAHAVPTADAVKDRLKVKRVKGNRELVRQLASSLLLGQTYATRLGVRSRSLGAAFKKHPEVKDRCS